MKKVVFILLFPFVQFLFFAQARAGSSDISYHSCYSDVIQLTGCDTGGNPGVMLSRCVKEKI